MSLNSRIKERREQLNMSRIELANKIGVTPSAIANYENDISSPKVELLYKLFDALQCDANYLYQDETKELTYKDKATPEEFETVIKKYRSLDKFGQETVNIVLNRESERTKRITDLESRTDNIIEFNSNTDDMSRLVEYFNSASAGTGIFIMGNEATDQLPIPNTEKNKKVDYAIKVSGNSMEPDFHDGDIALVSHREELNYGDVGIFIINNNAYIKEYGETELISRNQEAKNIMIEEHDNIVCMGKVIGKL